MKIKKIIAGVSDSDSGYDLSGNGETDVFDLCIMKRNILNNSSETVSDSDYPAISENVKIIGRTYRSDDVTWLTQSGSAVEFTVSGISAEITLAGDRGIYSGEDYRPRYAVYVDGELIEDSTMDTEEKSISLFDNETSGRTAQVKVIQLSEAMYGATGVKNISVTSGSAVAVKPTKAKNLKIEFIGDSITCAYGVEGLSSSESFKTTTENFTKSYAYLTAQKLDADYSAVCYSGHGIISGYTTGDKNTDSLIPDCYGLVSKFSGYDVEWDFSKSANDVVVINLGTNDSGYINGEPETRSAEFTEGYINFIETVREKNPDAYIICTLGTMGCEDVYELVEKAVSEYSSQSGDKRIMSYQSAVQNAAADGIGSDWHPSAATQQSSAYVLADKICQVLGMESDQIGLDVAADGTYDVSINKELGGNAAFYVGYDKSFWINMVTGGEKPEVIEALVSGIELKKDGIYRLEFDYNSGIDTDIPILVRSSDDNSKEYYSDAIKSSSETQHYTAEFTASVSDENAEIVFQLGGFDYYNATFSNIKLIKIG